MKHILRQTGFTLVELLVVMGITSLFLVVITNMFVAIGNVRNETETSSRVSMDGRFILARLTYDIQHATSVTTPAALGGTGTTLAIVIGGVTHTFSVTGGNLQVVNNLGTTVLNGNETTVSGFSVQRLGNTGGKDTVKLTFTVTSVAQANGDQETKTYVTTVGRR